MNAADITIADFQLKKRNLSVENWPDDVPQDLKELLVKGEIADEIIEVQLFHLDEHQEKVALNWRYESDGTKRLFEFAGLCLDILDNGGILCIDELDDSLHPKIVRFIIDLFHNPELNQHHAQLIFTTHDMTVLDPEIFRHDQIWLVEKDENNATQLYTLSDFSRPKKEALQQGYLNGRYGALPCVRKLRRIDGNI